MGLKIYRLAPLKISLPSYIMAKAMKAMKKKVISAKLARRHAFAGKLTKTKTGLSKTDLVKKKSSLRGKKNPWMAACKQARATLKIKGFCVIKKGTPFYKLAKELYKK